MRERLFKIVIILFFACVLFTCVEPYSPEIENFESLLVVDALVTDENRANYVRLTRSRKTREEQPVKVTGATVSIKDDIGNITLLNEKEAGEYLTDSLTFRGMAGRTYTLSIETSEGDKYESEPCLLYPVPEIDSLYFIKDHIVSDETGETIEGINIYIDSRGGGVSDYYRWTYEEWWKFNAPDPKMFEYINDSTINQLPEIKQTCWGNNKSDIIDIEASLPDGSGGFKSKPVLFVASAETDRLTVQYCIEVRQMSLSQNEYEYWNLMTELNEAGGDIFEKQPFQIFSNILCTTSQNIQVLGYFQVSGVKSKRKYITVSEISEMGLPIYRYECDRIEKGEIDYPSTSPGEGVTFNEINEGFLNSGYTFIAPIYDSEGELYRLVFVRPHCADCTLNGSQTKPSFWIDIN